MAMMFSELFWKPWMLALNFSTSPGADPSRW
jgi:hypothetical protein